MKREFSQQVLEKSRNIIFHWILYSGSQDASCERKDRDEEPNSRFSQFFERA